MRKILVVRILKTLILMILLNLLCFPTANADFGWEKVVGDDAGIGNGFGDVNGAVNSKATFGSFLYVGTYNDDNGCEVWRSSDGTTWNQVNTDGFEDATNRGASSMAVFGSYLYVGTYNVDNGCEVWRSDNGTNWTQVVGGVYGGGNGFGDPGNAIADSMAVFGSYLYVGCGNGSGCEVWRSNNGTNWDQVVGDVYGGGNGFGDSDNWYAGSMGVFGSYLYIGTSNFFDGCEIWRSNDGTNWTQVVGGVYGDGNGFGDSDNLSIDSMAVFGSFLYVGTYNGDNGCEVWRSNNGTNWDQVNTDGFSDADNDGAYSMAVFGNYLYVGTWNGFDGCEVWRSNNGTNWDQVSTDGFGDAYNEEASPMVIFGSYLYVGTSNWTDGCEMWRLPQDSDDDGIKDGEDKCPCHPNGINKGTCVMDVGNVVMSYEEGGDLISCDNDGDCTPTGGYCQKVQGDCNWNGIGDVCEGYADFDNSGSINLVDLLDLILCYGKTNFETHPQCEKYDINHDNRVSAWDYLILTLQYGRDGYDTCGAGIAPAQVAKTGQNICWDEWGSPPRDCEDTGEDGEYQKGVIGPSPRFTDHGDGTVTDNLTGLMWTRDAQQISGMMYWSNALSACNGLDFATHTDWRLPNVRELLSLIDYGEVEPSLPSGHPFLNVMLDYYWTSTTCATNSDYARRTLGGLVINGDKGADPWNAWCVRGETNGPAPVPKTGQTSPYATGDDGDLEKGVAWPNPRFTDNLDGTITDNLTGLIWLKDANCIATNYPEFDNDDTFGDGQVTWQHSLDFITGINDGTYSACGAGNTDWRLPNRNELASLVHDGYYGPAVPNTVGTGKCSPGDPFNNVQFNSYWSSTTSADDVVFAWDVSIHGFSEAYNFKWFEYYHVWPVRGGQ